MRENALENTQHGPRHDVAHEVFAEHDPDGRRGDSPWGDHPRQ